jgi:TPP-dependent 2-oxoacid decarboxylase
LGSAFYASKGFAVPVCTGAQLANPNLRPLVIVGDGVFQMTGMEISTAVRYHLNPIIILLNNRGYDTEWRLLDGPFKDLQPWQYNAIPEIVGGRKGFLINTEDEFDRALEAASKHLDSFCISKARLDPNDGSDAQQRLTNVICKRVR